MEQIKSRFMNEIAARLAGAAESDAKAEMIEELADNLARRYGDMTAAGVEESDAFDRAMEELGDVDELTAYLNSLEPEDTAGTGELDELFRAVEDVGRAAAEMGRKAVDRAGDLLHSETARSAVEESKKAIQKAGDFLRKVAEQGAVAWNGRNVKLDFSEPDEPWNIPSQGLLRLDIELPGGDVEIARGMSADAPVRVEGDVEKLDVSVTEDGTLTIREKPTASSQFFSLRGLTWADVSLTLPARRWESIHVSANSGDVDIAGGLEVSELSLRTSSGDIDCRVDSCARAALRTVSGDMDWEGSAASFQADTVSGDIDVDGIVGEASVSAISGDVTLSGSVERARVRAMSGDIRVWSGLLPRELVLRSKSGDVGVKLPDQGPFRARLETASGHTRCEFPAEWLTGPAAEGGEPQYDLASISGDVSLKKY